MKRNFFYLLIFFFTVLPVTGIHAQKIDSVLSAYQDQSPVERIHIHFDKSVYNRDETIFYKVYLMAAGAPSLLSKNMYVEWYDDKGNFIKQTVAPMFQSTAQGSFDLPGDYKGNFVHVKAFTRWMLNDSSFLYERDVSINTPLSSSVKTTPLPRTTVTTFPEGGFLVNNVVSRVAFKAANQFGIPVLVRGTVTNDKNKFIDSIRVQHDGMGSFMLMPVAGESYQLNWTDENGNKGVSPVAAAKPEGVTMTASLTNTYDKVIVQLKRTTGIPDQFKTVNLLVHSNEQVYYKAAVKLSEKMLVNVPLAVDEMPTGILQFTLFSSDGIPIAERIMFVNNHLHEFGVKLTTPLVNLEKRGKNAIEVFVSDTAYANMSISVTDADIATNDQQTIYSDFLLSDDIKGRVNNPGYYLNSDADSIAKNLDLVMLTNGWRRYDWDKIRAGMMPVITYAPETEFMKLTGKVFGAKTIGNVPLQLNMIITAKDSSKQFLFVPVNKDGSFEDKSMFIYDTVRIYYGFNGAGNNKLTDQMQVHIENGLLRSNFKTITYPPRWPFASWSDSMARNKMDYFLSEQEKLKKALASATLQEVVVKSKAKSPEQQMDERYTSGLFSGMGDGYSFDLTNDKGYSLDALSYLQGKVAGLIISGNGPQTTLSWRGATPDIYLNETKVDVTTVQTMSVTDIAYIKVFRPPFFGSPGGGGGGAIAIYTKKGGDNKQSAGGRGLESAVLGGYSKFKEFVSPSYEKPTDTFEPDLRTTLYWSPYVLTNKKNPRVRIQFFNNDNSKKLQVVLEGMNADGKMVRVVKMIE